MLYVSKTDVPKDAHDRLQRVSGMWCGLNSVLAIRDYEGAGRERRHKFCLPDTGIESQDPATAMAYAYIDYYEQNASFVAAKDGGLIYTAAMIVKWPCAK
jgi:hypothetical protein